MSKRAGQLLWNRISIPLDDTGPGDVVDVDTGIWQDNRSFEADSVGEPTMPEPGADPLTNPSRLQVIPESPLESWLGVSHGQPFAVLNLSGPNVGKVTMHVIFTNTSGLAVTINVFFWNPDTKIGPGTAAIYAALVVDPIPLGNILEGAAGGFRVLGSAAVTNTGNTTVAGDVGVSAAALASITGFPPGTLTGTKYGTDSVGTVPEDAHTSLVAAIADAAARTGAVTLGNELGGLTLTPGVYDTGAGNIAAGALTLDALGNPDAVFIIRCASTFVMAAATSVLLAGGALAANVFFVLQTSATLGTSAVFNGNILAKVSITANGGAGAQVHGRLLAGATAGSVTFAAITIVGP